MIGTLCRLAFADLRKRLLASALIIMLSGAAAAAIVLTLEVGTTARDPWMRTFIAAHGAHVLANVATEADAQAIAALPGVVEHGGPMPSAWTTLLVDGHEVRVFLLGMPAQVTVNVPIVVDGVGIQLGTIVLERSFAQAEGIAPGTPLTLLTTAGDTLTLDASGTAVVPSQPRYPRRNPGLAWVSRETFAQVFPDTRRWRWNTALRLSDPAAADAFSASAATLLPPGSAEFSTWQMQRADILRDAEPIRIILTVYTLLLLLVSISVVGILIGARVSGQYREIALLKAVGLTPRQVSAVFAIEAATLGALGVLLGSIPGVLLAPRLAAPAASTLIGSPQVAANAWHLLVAAAVILPVIVVSAYLAARRRTRVTVLQAMRAGTLLPTGGATRGLARIAALLPIPLMLGVRDLLARRQRAFWLLCVITVTATALVVTLAIQAALAAQPGDEVSDVPAELSLLVFTLDAVLAILTLTALVALALLSVRERLRDVGVLRTLGLTPRQVIASLVSTHTVLALLASLLAIPLGLGLFVLLYRMASGSSDIALFAAAWRWLLAVPLVVPLATAIVSGLPARVATGIPVADAVRHE